MFLRLRFARALGVLLGYALFQLLVVVLDVVVRTLDVDEDQVDEVAG